MSHLTKIKRPTDRMEWLRLRHKSIGSSEGPIIAGLNTHTSPYQLYLEKIAPDPADHEANFQMEWGTMVEDVVAQYYRQKTGNMVRRDNFVRFHPEFPYISANIDRLIVRDKNGERFKDGDGILEIKTTSEHAKESWKDEIPPYYYCQVQHQMLVTGIKWGAVVAVIGNREFRIVPILRDEPFIEVYLGVLRMFWEERVLKLRPPEWTFQDLDLIYARGGKDAVAPSAIIPKLLRAFELKKIKGVTDKEFDAIKDELRLLIGECDGLTVGGTLVATWKEQKPSPKFDLEAFKAVHPDLYEEFMRTPEHGIRKLLFVEKALPLLIQESERLKQLTA